MTPSHPCLLYYDSYVYFYPSDVRKFRVYTLFTISKKNIHTYFLKNCNDNTLMFIMQNIFPNVLNYYTTKSQMAG